MSIIERAENRAPVLQRRPRALFETVPIPRNLPVAVDVMVGSDRGEQAEGRPPSVAEELRSPREWSRASLRAMAESGSHAEAAPAHRASTRSSDSTQSLQEERRPEPSVPTLHPTVASETRAPDLGARPVARLIDAHIERWPAQRERASDRGRVESETAPIAKPGRTELNPTHQEERPLPRARPELAQTAFARATPVNPNNQTPPQAARPTAIPPKRTPRTAVMLAKAQSTRNLPPPVVPAPTPVHISIGRVEVRASSAPQSPARPATHTGPRLKLDDYLSDRNRSRR
jgi:hypothetical protein